MNFAKVSLHSFQPPGQEHIVFTPAATVATGSHYYNYHTLHLTEWTRRIQHFQTVTNQLLSGVKELLNVMMLDFVNHTGKGKPLEPEVPTSIVIFSQNSTLVQ
jgi:hypothetical protein